MTIEDSGGGGLAEIELLRDGLRLRSFSPADLDLVEEASSDSFIPSITTVPDIYSPAEGAAFIERQISRRINGEGWSLAIHDDIIGRSVGQVGLWVGSLAKGRAELGYWVVPSARGAGAAGKAVGLLSEWAFANLDISRLSLFIEPWNAASIRTAEAAGYERECLLRSWERVDGVSKDMYSFVRVQ